MNRADNNQAEIVKKLKAVGASVFITTQVGRGFPDLIVGYQHVTYLMEIKNPETKYKVSQRQVAFADSWKGGKVYVVSSPEEALKAIGIEL